MALGALPWIVAPVAAAAALRPLLAKVRAFGGRKRVVNGVSEGGLYGNLR